jgi:hypothetical protein
MQHNRQWRGNQIHHILVGSREAALTTPRTRHQLPELFAVVIQRPGLQGGRRLAALARLPSSRSIAT